eukprot:ANDGO_06414.mRNA.1 hypothetical protein
MIGDEKSLLFSVLCSHSAHRPRIRIPETVLFQKGKITSWIYTADDGKLASRDPSLYTLKNVHRRFLRHAQDAFSQESVSYSNAQFPSNTKAPLTRVATEFRKPGSRILSEKDFMILVDKLGAYASKSAPSASDEMYASFVLQMYAPSADDLVYTASHRRRERPALLGPEGSKSEVDIVFEVQSEKRGHWISHRTSSSAIPSAKPRSGRASVGILDAARSQTPVASQPLQPIASSPVSSQSTEDDEIATFVYDDDSESVVGAGVQASPEEAPSRPREPSSTVPEIFVSELKNLVLDVHRHVEATFFFSPTGSKMNFIRGEDGRFLLMSISSIQGMPPLLCTFPQFLDASGSSRSPRSPRSPAAAARNRPRTAAARPRFSRSSVVSNSAATTSSTLSDSSPQRSPLATIRAKSSMEMSVSNTESAQPREYVCSPTEEQGVDDDNAAINQVHSSLQELQKGIAILEMKDNTENISRAETVSLLSGISSVVVMLVRSCTNLRRRLGYLELEESRLNDRSDSLIDFENSLSDWQVRLEAEQELVDEEKRGLELASRYLNRQEAHSHSPEHSFRPPPLAEQFTGSLGQSQRFREPDADLSPAIQRRSPHQFSAPSSYHRHVVRPEAQCPSPSISQSRVADKPSRTRAPRSRNGGVSAVSPSSAAHHDAYDSLSQEKEKLEKLERQLLSRGALLMRKTTFNPS